MKTNFKIIEGSGIAINNIDGFRKEIVRKRVAAYCRVSTDQEDQMKSYEAQKEYYTNKIRENKEWLMVGIYADADRTGTTTKGRNDFVRLISDAMHGKIDLIITKSISRFARNTLDTITYTRQLREKGVEIYFEEEDIHTLNMSSEFMLTLFSSIYQQEVENTSNRVKQGLKMRQEQGKIAGYHFPTGYRYDKYTGEVNIVEEEAEIVRYIFRRYIEGAGCDTISKELYEKGFLTPRGKSKKWETSVILKILQNRVYIGEIIMGKSYTLDPISKKRIINQGEKNKYVLTDYHEPIISKEDFNEVQKRLEYKRSLRMKRQIDETSIRFKFNVAEFYPFSKITICPYCGSSLTRSVWNSGKPCEKVYWHCMTAQTKGKALCPNSKSVHEDILKQAFVEAFNILIDDDYSEIMEDFLLKVEAGLSGSSSKEEMNKLKTEIKKLEDNYSYTINLASDGKIDKSILDRKLDNFNQKLEKKRNELAVIEDSYKLRGELKGRVASFREFFKTGEHLEKFDEYVFRSIVENVIVGGYDEKGNIDPYLITFILRNCIDNMRLLNLDPKIVKGDSGADLNLLQLIKFDTFYHRYIFMSNPDGTRTKISKETTTVIVAVNANEI